MSPAFRLHRRPRHLLESIVADSRGSVESLFEVSRFDQIPLTICMMTPDAGKTIGLQLHTYGERVAFLFGHVLLQPMDFLCDAKKILNVMADLVSDDIRLGKIPRSAEALRHLSEERQVKVHLAILRAIEWAHDGRRGAACRLHGAREQDQARIFILASGLRQELLPCGFRV